MNKPDRDREIVFYDKEMVIKLGSLFAWVEALELVVKGMPDNIAGNIIDDGGGIGFDSKAELIDKICDAIATLTKRP